MITRIALTVAVAAVLTTGVAAVSAAQASDQPGVHYHVGPSQTALAARTGTRASAGPASICWASADKTPCL